MDVRADTRDDDDLLAAIMLNVQRTLSFAPDKILCGDLSTNLSIVQFMGSSVSRHRRWSGKAIRAHILAELCTLLVNLRKLSANSEKLEEYIVGLGKKIVLEKNTELMSPEVSAEVVREPSIAENESFASVEGPLAKGNEAQKSASEAFWVPYSDNDTKPAEEEKSAKKKKRSRSLQCVLIFLYLLYVTISYLVYSQKKLVRRLSSRWRPANYSPLSTNDMDGDSTLPVNRHSDFN